VGLVNHDIDPVIDLGESMPINRIITHYANSKGDWIHPPKAIEVFVSEDGINFFSEGRKLIDPEEKMNNSIETIAFSLKQVKGRYVKLLASTTGVIPKGYPGAGEGAWLFIDEVIVE
jgi:hexosaminidase